MLALLWLYIYLFFYYMKNIKLLLIAYVASVLLYSHELFAASATDEQQVVWSDGVNIIFSFFSADNLAKGILAIVVIVCTFFVSKILSSKLVSYIEKNTTEESSREELTWVISRTVNVTVLIIGFSITLGILWIDMWIFMGWIWFGIWYTLRTFLTNFVAGILMVTQWFYHNWDVIEVDNKMGKIRKVNALFTAVEQFNGVVFYIPNITFIEDKVTNYYTNDKRRVEVDILIDYDSNVHIAKQTVQMVLDQFPNILQAPASDVIVDKLWDNGILLRARYWTPVTDNYFHTKSNITETLNLALKKQWVSIAYPHLTVTHSNLWKTLS